MKLNEGGNIFKNSAGQPATQRIRREDIPATVLWLELRTGLSFPTRTWLGTTGKKETSGDLDISVDEKLIDKETLIQTLLRNGVDKSDIKKSGDSVHVRAPIGGDPNNGFVQADLMFGEPDWQSFSMAGAPEGSSLTGMSRHIILASVVTAINPNLKWSYKHGLVDRQTNTTIEDGKSAKKLSEVTGIPITKLNSADDILSVISQRPDYERLISAARETLAKNDIMLPESAPLPGTAAWFRTFSDKFV
jgi:hypothetical protein